MNGPTIAITANIRLSPAYVAGGTEPRPGSTPAVRMVPRSAPTIARLEPKVAEKFQATGPVRSRRPQPFGLVCQHTPTNTIAITSGANTTTQIHHGVSPLATRGCRPTTDTVRPCEAGVARERSNPTKPQAPQRHPRTSRSREPYPAVSSPFVSVARGLLILTPTPSDPQPGVGSARSARGSIHETVPRG